MKEFKECCTSNLIRTSCDRLADLAEPITDEGVNPLDLNVR